MVVTAAVATTTAIIMPIIDSTIAIIIDYRQQVCLTTMSTMEWLASMVTNKRPTAVFYRENTDKRTQVITAHYQGILLMIDKRIRQKTSPNIKLHNLILQSVQVIFKKTS